MRLFAVTIVNKRWNPTDKFHETHVHVVLAKNAVEAIATVHMTEYVEFHLMAHAEDLGDARSYCCAGYGRMPIKEVREKAKSGEWSVFSEAEVYTERWSA